ncbi:hypothetical protein U9R62_03825 [Cylindrospermopsis raciborskii DSH]
MSDKEIEDQVDLVSIYARVFPEQQISVLSAIIKDAVDLCS